MTDGPIISREALLKGNLPEEVVMVAGIGPVRVRSISRAEYMSLRVSDGEGWEIGLVSAGLVDPALSTDDVEALRKVVDPKTFDDLAGEVLRVSGLRKTAEEAVAEAKQSFPDTEGSGV